MRHFLIIDTALSESHVVLVKDLMIYRVEHFPSLDTTKYLLITIDTLLKEASLLMTDLSLIACSKGPGTFTGTRVGVMTAKALSYALNIPLIGFLSLIPYTSHLPILYDAKGEKCFFFNKGEIQKICYGDLPLDLIALSPHPDVIQKYLPQAKIDLPVYQESHLLKHLLTVTQFDPAFELVPIYSHSP